MTQTFKQPLSAAQQTVLRNQRNAGIRKLLETKIAQLVKPICTGETTNTVVGKALFPGTHYDNHTNGVTMSIILTGDFNLADITPLASKPAELSVNETSELGTLWNVLLERLEADFESALCPLWRHNKRAVQSKPIEYTARLAVGDVFKTADPSISGMVQVQVKGMLTFWLDNRPKLYLLKPDTQVTSLTKPCEIAGYSLPELFASIDLSKYDVVSHLSAESNSVLKEMLPGKSIHCTNDCDELVLQLGANDILVALDVVKFQSLEGDRLKDTTLQDYLTRTTHVITVSEESMDFATILS